ncbi:MAG: hypothetical protein ACLFWF_05670 [Alphaproteobacteria bacterium]
MTAEILVMNRSAVALAAQGGLSAGYGPDPAVTRDSAKIFPLFEGMPVALMIYGRADLLGHPWQSLITHYLENSDPPDAKTIGDWAAHFFAFLDDNVWMFHEQEQRSHLEGLLAAIFGRIIDEAAEIYAFPPGERLNELEALNRAIDLWHRRYEQDAHGQEVPVLEAFEDSRKESFSDRFSNEIESVLDSVFGQVRLDAGRLEKLWDIAFYAVTRNRFYEGCTGLVFAGYGKEELMPAMCSWYVSSVVNYRMKRTPDWQKAITSRPPQSLVVPFADAPVTNRLMRGLDTGFENDILRAVEQLVGEVGVHLVNGTKQLDMPVRKAMKERLFSRVLPEAMTTFQGWMREYIPERSVSPILGSLESMGADDLAHTARSLIGLNRLGREEFTLSEAMDTAVVTRKEGFTWHSRQA